MFKRSLGLGVNQRVQLGSNLNLSVEYKAVYDAVSVKPSNQIALAQNAFVKALVDGGQWAKFACIIPYAWGMPTASDSLFWANNIARKATLSATAPTYDPLLGWTGNGTSSYIDTTFNPSLDGDSKYTQNDASAGWLFTNSRTTISNGGSGISVGTNGVCIYPQLSASQAYARIQSDYNALTKTAGTNRLFTLVRKSSTLINLWQDRTVLGSDITKASGVLQNLTMQCLHVNGDAASFQNDTIGLFFAGAQLTQTDINTICDAWDILQLSINKGTVLMSDSCDGTVIDLTKWDIANSSTNVATFEQNNELIMNSFITGVAGNYFPNMIASDISTLWGVWKFSIACIANSGSNPYVRFGLTPSKSADVSLIGFVNNLPERVDYELRQVAATLLYGVTTAFESFAEIKIVVTSTHNIKAYLWTNDAWVQIGIDKTIQAPGLFLFMATRGYVSGVKTSMRDVFITKYDYSTLNPV